MTYISRKTTRHIWRGLLPQVRQILIAVWHPVGIEVPNDEYDSYALTIAGMLLRGCTNVELMNYLAESEADILGETSVDVERRARVALALKRTIGAPGT